MPSGIEIPGPIALTDSNSSRRSGSGRLSETLTSVWGNNPPSTGPSASNSVLPSPLEGPTSRSALLNALKPLASVPEGSAIPEVVHADPGAQAGTFEAHQHEPPKTPKAETPRPSASPSRIPVSASVAATSPKPSATPKAASRAPTVTVSPRTGGTHRGLSVYSQGSQPPVDAVPPEPPAIIQSEPQTVATPKHVSRVPTKASTRAASPQPPATAREQEAVQSELGIPGSISRVPTKPPTRTASPQPPVIPPEPEVPISQPTDPAAFNSGPWPHVPAAGAEPSATGEGVPAPAPEQPEPVPAATNVAEVDESFVQPKSKARKGSKASRAASMLASKVATPKGSQTPKSVEPTAEAGSAIASEEVPVTEGARSLSAAQSPLAPVPEHTIPEANTSRDNPTPEAPHEGQFGFPGGLFTTNPDETAATSTTPAEAPTQSEPPSLSGFGAGLGGTVGGMFGAALGWGKKDKNKSPTPGASTPAWGGAFGGLASSVAESTGGGGWGSATGNNSRSNSMWHGANPSNKSANASTADLFSNSLHNDPNLDNVPATELAEFQNPSLPGRGLPTETQGGATQGETGGEGAAQGDTWGEGTAHGDTWGEGTAQGDTWGEGAAQGDTWGGGAHQQETQVEGELPEETRTREHLTLMTDVPVEPDAATAGPPTAGDSPEGGEGGGEGEGEGEGGEDVEKAADEEWAIPVKVKKGKSSKGTTPVTPGAGAAGAGDKDDWATAGTAGKKKKKKGR